MTALFTVAPDDPKFAGQDIPVINDVVVTCLATRDKLKRVTVRDRDLMVSMVWQINLAASIVKTYDVLGTGEYVRTGPNFIPDPVVLNQIRSMLGPRDLWGIQPTGLLYVAYYGPVTFE